MAVAEEVERVIGYVEFEQFPHCILDLLDTGVAKFGYFSTIVADEVVMLPVSVRFFIERQVFAKLMALDEVAVDEEFERVIDRGTADAVALVFHVDIQSLGVEVVAAAVNFFENRKTLRGLAESVLFEMGSKNTFDFLDDFFFISDIHASNLFKKEQRR